MLFAGCRIELFLYIRDFCDSPKSICPQSTDPVPSKIKYHVLRKPHLADESTYSIENAYVQFPKSKLQTSFF